MLTLIELTTIAFRLVALGTFVIVLAKCAFDFWRVKGGRGVIVLKVFAALAVWVLVSWGMMSMFATAVYSSAQPDGPGGGGPAGVIALLEIYTVACGSLSYWVLRRA